jgi:hypothetical protein
MLPSIVTQYPCTDEPREFSVFHRTRASRLLTRPSNLAKLFATNRTATPRAPGPFPPGRARATVYRAYARLPEGGQGESPGLLFF